jgi:hypothetical protein
MKKFFLCALLCLMAAPAQAQLEVGVPVAGQSGRQCYTRDEAEAEQGIRIHSELMVIALNCQHMTPAGWKNFYVQYQQITARDANIIGNYENVLINYFALAGRPNPERSLHDLRTDFANKVSTDAAKMRPDIFCATFAPRLPKVDKMSPAEFKAWAADLRPDHPVSKPLCQ